MTQQNTIKTFNYKNNVRGAYIYTQILAELFLAARDASKHGNNWDELDEYYQAMNGQGDYAGTTSSERAEYMLDQHGDFMTGYAEDFFNDSKYSYEWFVEQHNKAVEIAKSFNLEHLDIIK